MGGLVVRPNAPAPSYVFEMLNGTGPSPGEGAEGASDPTLFLHFRVRELFESARTKNCSGNAMCLLGVGGFHCPTVHYPISARTAVISSSIFSVRHFVTFVVHVFMVRCQSMLLLIAYYKGHDKHIIPGMDTWEMFGEKTRNGPGECHRGYPHENSFGDHRPCFSKEPPTRDRLDACLWDTSTACLKKYVRASIDPAVRR